MKRMNAKRYAKEIIISPTEISIMHTSRLTKIILNGLVFSPNLDGAAGLSIFDGANLAAGNTIIDPISGFSGVPAVTPIGRGNTVTNVGIGAI